LAGLQKIVFMLGSRPVLGFVMAALNMRAPKTKLAKQGAGYGLIAIRLSRANFGEKSVENERAVDD